MAKQLVFLEYNFLFDPSSTWSSVAQFEADLASFLSFHGKEAQVMTPMGGYQGKRVVFVKGVDSFTPPGVKTPGNPPTPSGKLDQLQKRFQNPNEKKQGQFISRKGYMKR